MTARELLSRLEAVRPVKGGWQARCPAHPDKSPSLSITESDGRVLLKCFAGCETSAIVAAMGLEMSDLFTEPKANGNGHGGEMIARYPYQDESGKLLFEVVRYEPKDFRQRRPDGKGGWTWSLNGVRRVPYNLPEAIKAEDVLILEGEKDVETARKLGIIATCNPGGAGKWRPEYSEILRGKRVTVICDSDAPGVAHGRQVAQSLLGIAREVKLIEAMPLCKDLSEFCEKLPDDATRRQMIEALIADAPELTAADVAKWQPAKGSGLTLTRLGDLIAEPEEQVPWLLEGILPAGGLGLLAAKPKVGKSTLARCLALAVASGEPFLDRPTLKGAVIYLALEEKRSEVRAHFRAMGATGQEDILIHAASAPQDAIPSITVEVKRHKPVLLIIDPVFRFVRVKDGNDYSQVSAALEPLLALARENGCHVLLVHHLGKGERSEAMDGILGSTALFAGVDSALVMKRYERYRTLQSRQRYGDDLQEITLEFNPATRTLSLGAARADAEAQSVSKDILDTLQAAGESKTEPEITEAVEGKTEFVRRALRQLVEQGKVSREGGGKRGDPYRYRFSFSCSQYIVGTREQETQKPADTRINIEPILVPTLEQKSFLVPANGEAQKPASGPVENRREKQAVVEWEA